MLTRRRLLLAGSALPFAAHAAVEYPAVTPRPLAFPRDHGAHPDYRIEWWYLTGWLDATPPLGFQVTFFRTRTPIAPANPSRFAAHQLIIAHAAIAARGFALRLNARPTQPILLQGEAGFSRKGPKPEQASYYYSQPQLRVDTELERGGKTAKASGIAWLDHEWSSTLLDPDAAGWDWIGMNLDDGAALTAFRIRRKNGGPPVYAYAAMRAAGSAHVQVFAPDEVRFEPLARWTSPRTRATYPVAQRIAIGARAFETRPLFDDQELDSRASAGAVYWEGASTLLESGRPVGRGYLEMTGYVAPMRL